jgi:hypothetical protein
MSEQRCWDCAHGKRMGQGAKTGTPDESGAFKSRVYCRVAAYLSRAGPSDWYRYHDGGEKCPGFTPREEGKPA